MSEPLNTCDKCHKAKPLVDYRDPYEKLCDECMEEERNQAAGLTWETGGEFKNDRPFSEWKKKGDKQ